ncbi:hypothetical protein ABIA35_005997 [Catenulispora sp. MAP12-49]|uniref:hypothetical protein n=1 Tax=Catenulispora sp. MAP12-49 TaxID=3156302 RepID=UPI00351390E4
MSTAAILAAGAAATLGLAALPLAVAAVASPVNRARDARRQVADDTEAGRETSVLVAQIRDGVGTAALVDDDPGKLASAAHAAAAGLAAWLAAEGHPEDVPFMRRVLDELGPILAAEHAEVPAPSTAPPLSAAVALQVLLHRLHGAYDGPQRVRVAIAAGSTAEAVRALPGGAAVDFNPLGEHNPVPIRRAQAVWISAAREVGMGGWERAVHH